MDLDAIRKLGTDSIGGGAGESVRYEPEFDQLSTEIEKLSAVEQTPVNWRIVVNLSSGLLKDKGKDLLVASYLAFGLYDQQGYSGLAAGIDVINGLVDNFWDGLFPELRRLRARIAAPEWFAARLEKALETASDPGMSDREAIEQCIAGINKLLADEQNRFAGDSPNLGPARRGLKAKLDTIPLPEPEPEPTPEPVAGEAAPAEAGQPVAAAAAAPPPPPPPPPEPDPAENAEAVLEALAKYRKQQIEYAAVLHATDDTDPRGYLLLREALWTEAVLAERDKQSTGGAEFIQAQQQELEEGEFEDVLERVEKLLLEHPLWLDLQLLTVQALEGLGRRYRKAHRAVLASLSFLLQRDPKLADAKNQKGEAFASDAVQVWLSNEVLAAVGNQGDANAVESVGKEARKLVARGQLGDAMRLLTQRIEMTASRRGRFVLRLDLAQLCIEAGRMELAVPQLEQLEQEVTHFSVEEWEPDLATSVVRWLWQCCTGPKPVPSLAERSKDIYARLCRLDPAAAVSAPGPSGD
ncbi:MAG: type VI secretion system protein VasJ [Planctomycetota bacterium]|jgi:type VI secretion system protein VasJ